MDWTIVLPFAPPPSFFSPILSEGSALLRSCVYNSDDDDEELTGNAK